MKYQIWSTGYRATGESSDAIYWGEVEANSFIDACDKRFDREPTYARNYVDAHPAIWACLLYDNEKDARNTIFG